MNLKEFADIVSRQADTEGTKIGRAEVGRVLSIALRVLIDLSVSDLLALIARAKKFRA